METIKRRSFVKGFGLIGIVAAGVAGYQQVRERIVYKQDELPTKELEQQLDTNPVLQMNAVYGTPKPRPSSPYMFISSWNSDGSGDYVEGTRKEVSVKMVPGPDGKLYVKENDIWRKI